MRGGGSAQEAEHGTQAVDSDNGEHATDDIDAIVNVGVIGGHNGYLLCGEHPNRPHEESVGAPQMLVALVHIAFSGGFRYRYTEPEQLNNTISERMAAANEDVVPGIQCAPVCLAVPIVVDKFSISCQITER